MQVFLIRHPKPVIEAGICYGRLDVDAHAPHAVAFVAHAGVLRALVGHWQRLPVAEWTQLSFDYGSVTTLHIEHPL